jgi:hypothetical protein
MPRYFILVLTLPLITLACILLAAIPIAPGDSALDHFLIGLVLGTFYALGPGPLILRLPMSVLWVACLLLVFCLGSAVRHQGDIGAIMTYSQVAQWVASQIPYWTIALIFRLRLRHWSQQDDEGLRAQFGIGQLMIITAIIGVLLAIGRILVAANFSDLDLDPEMPIFFFLVGTAIIVTLPLVCAAFLSRYAMGAMLAAVIFVVAVTIMELPLLEATIGTRGGPDVMHLIWINTFTTVWVLAMVLAARLAGYQFGFADDSVGEPAK